MGSLEEKREKRKARVTAKVTETETLSLDEEALSEIVEEEMIESGDFELTLDGNLSISSPTAVQSESPIDTIKGIGEDVKTIADNLGEISEGLKDLGAGSDFSKAAEDLKKAAGSLPDKINEGEKLFNEAKDAAQPLIDEGKKAINEAKEAAKPVIDEAKKAANQLKEQGKNAAAKAGGAAITAASGGVIPPKLGEWASKKALNKAEKKIKKRAGKAKNKLAAKTASKTEELKEKAKNNEHLNKIKEKAGNAVNTTVKAIKAIKFYKNLKKWGPIILSAVACIFIIALIMIIVQRFMPGAFGDVKEESEAGNYSSRDAKIIEKLEKINSKYPNADGGLVMSAVAYPYYELLQSGEVFSAADVSEDEEGETSEEEEIIEEEIDGEVEEEIEITEEEEEQDNDIYLDLFAKLKYRNKYKKLLKIYHESGKEAFIEYLKQDYFSSDKGYKKLLKNVETDDLENIKSKIIEDIEGHTELFRRYIRVIEECSTTLISAGTVEIDDVLKKPIFVDVKVPSCKSGKGVWDCQSVYANPIPLKNYVYGGTYEEFNSMDVEKTAAQMLAIKSFIVQRSKSMGWGIRQDANGNYVVTARNNTNDLVYCDVDLGCSSGATKVGDGNAKRGPISEKQRQVFDKAWEKIADKFIYDKDNKKTVGAFCQSRSGSCSFCKKGSCLAHEELANYTNTTYESIIGIQYSNYTIIQIDGDFANVTIAGDTECTASANMDIDDSNFVYYAQSDYPNVGFCGRKLGGAGDSLCSPGSSICTSGCGLVSMTMVTATLTQNNAINPLSINKEVRVGTDCGPGISGSRGGNMFPYIAKKYGLTVTAKHAGNNAINDIKKGLDEGGLIIASVCGGLKSNGTYSLPNSCGGHFIVVRGYEGDNVIISDPYQNNRLKNFSGCILKKNGKCIKHKMSFSSFHKDLKKKNSTLYIIKGNIPFQEIKKEEQTN